MYVSRFHYDPRVVSGNRRARLLDLPTPVWLIGWVSLATDAASEAIYPLLPFFLFIQFLFPALVARGKEAA